MASGAILGDCPICGWIVFEDECANDGGIRHKKCRPRKSSNHCFMRINERLSWALGELEAGNIEEAKERIKEALTYIPRRDDE